MTLILNTRELAQRAEPYMAYLSQAGSNRAEIGPTWPKPRFESGIPLGLWQVLLQKNTENEIKVRWLKLGKSRQVSAKVTRWPFLSLIEAVDLFLDHII